MKTLELNGYLAGVNARKAKLAPEGAVLAVESCRNGGARRTAGKRSALKSADARAQAAKVQPVLSNY
ncbi:hypothetical protein [Allopontixanthobacter sediminis]|uniref:Uncharacterized protein n=1 Tax=Allopontixanthobacter sediminis TaxID=1689985 RepID=A0A845B5C8_9SPHN|nr:hypothetical protein [Allopontixanthobacter sediminis]MXP45356.1 hypothetical protein [Allopontixanthobacter sediminis]